MTRQLRTCTTQSETYVSIDLKKPEHQKQVEKADLILTLTDKHKEDISNFLETDRKTILTIKEFGGESGDIKDPSMKGLEGFRIARDEIIQSLVKGLNKYKWVKLLFDYLKNEIHKYILNIVYSSKSRKIIKVN